MSDDAIVLNIMLIFFFRTLQNDEINVLQDSIRDSLKKKFGVELR
jgi:phenylalanyl-tRNA synthetase beta subunit